MSDPIIEEYVDSRLRLVEGMGLCKAKERALDTELRTKMRLGGFPEWFSMYYDAETPDDWLSYLNRLLTVWEQTEFEPTNKQRAVLAEASQTAKAVAQLRRDHSLMQSMRNEISFAIMQMSHGAVDQDIRRDAEKLIKTKVKPIDYLDDLRFEGTDSIESLFIEKKPAPVEELSLICRNLDQFSPMERICYLAHVTIPMSFQQVADELTRIAYQLADKEGWSKENLGITKDSVAQHADNFSKRLSHIKNWSDSLFATDTEEIEEYLFMPFDAYEDELRRRFKNGLYQKREKRVMVSNEPTLW